MFQVSERLEYAMNTFYEHHQPSIKLNYRCFDRILLNGLIQPFQQPERVIGFFNAYRGGERVTRHRLRDIAEQFHNWVKNRSQKWGAPILEAPAGRRDDFVAPYFRRAKTDQVLVILKAREPVRILTAIGQAARWHLQLAWRWIVQYNFYLCDRNWGRMFVRICPYLPFSARVCLNQHHWLANKMRAQGIDFEQHSNAFLHCRHPEKLQELADSLTPHDLLSCGQKWLAALTPFFKESERKQAGCQHRLFFSQVEYCDNLIFRRRAALDQLGQRLLDANRSLGQPNKITTIFGRKVTRRYQGKLQTVIEDLDLPNPVIRTHYANGFIKQYVRDHLCLRTEPASNDVTDYGVNKAVENLPQLRQKLSTICDNYLSAQQDILETFIDRGQLRSLTQPTILPSGKRIPGLKLDNPRQLALMHALVRFAHLAAGSTFTTAEIYPHTLRARGLTAQQYSLASLRYDLAKLRAKHLLEKLPKSRRYRLTPEGYSICVLFLKLFERIYGPLTAGVLQPYRADSKLISSRRTELDRLYQKVLDHLDKLICAVGLKAA
jgi:hypothetical protein